MEHTSRQSPLSRLLYQNTVAHDIERQMLREPVALEGLTCVPGTTSQSQIAAMQDELDRSARASLVTCWLGILG